MNFKFKGSRKYTIINAGIKLLNESLISYNQIQPTITWLGKSLKTFLKTLYLYYIIVNFFSVIICQCKQFGIVQRRT